MNTDEDMSDKPYEMERLYNRSFPHTVSSQSVVLAFRQTVTTHYFEKLAKFKQLSRTPTKRSRLINILYV